MTMNNLQQINSSQQQAKTAYTEVHVNVDSSGSQQFSKTSKSSETVPIISNQFNKRKKQAGQRQRNIKSIKDANSSANQQCTETTSVESVTSISHHFNKRKKPVNQRQRNIKPIKDANSSPNQQCTETTSAESVTSISNHLKVSKKSFDCKWTSTGSKLNIKKAETLSEPKLDESDIRLIWGILDRSNMLGESKSILEEKRGVSAASLPQLNGSGILPKEEITHRNVHSLSSSCEDSSINTEQNSLDIIDSIIEDSSNNGIIVTSELESTSNEVNDETVSHERLITPTVEINKDSDLEQTQTAFKSTEVEASKLDESIYWDCEELEESFSDIVDDLEKCMEDSPQESHLQTNHCSDNCDSTRLSTTKSHDGQVTNMQFTTPTKRKPQSNENPNAASPTKKEKFSPHIVKSPKKYFGSGDKRKLIKENQNNPSTSFKTTPNGLPSVSNTESIRSQQTNVIGNQKLISQYFTKNRAESDIGPKLKQFIDQEKILDLTSESPKNTNVEDNNNILSSSNVYLRIFEDCLEHIQKVILPVEGYLLDDNEIRFLNSVNNLNSSAKCLYFRLLDRKHYWIKRTKINYEDLNPSLNNDLDRLEMLGFLTSDYTKEDIDVLLELLNIPDLKKLCRMFRVGDQGKKCSLILNLTRMSEKQSTLDGKQESHLLIRKKLPSFLNCVKLTPEPREAILKCLRICSFSYNKEVEEKLVQNIVSNHFQVIYPKFTVKHAVVFHNKENFDEYEKSLQLLSQVMADKKPNYEILLELIVRSRTSFEQCLSSESKRSILERTPDYLMKFTAANVYAGIVFNNINVLKKDKSNKRIEELVAFLENLIAEKIFLSKKRGLIYDALIRIYRQKKDYSKALYTFKKAREDDSIPKVIQFSLLAQMKPLLKRKAVHAHIKAQLQEFCNISSLNCSNIVTKTVFAKLLPSDKPNRKKVYVTENESCTYYQSVEELVVNDFKKNGWYGVHDEGSLLKNIIVACFWDIIFGSPTLENETMSVFVSRYQMRPLDWGSRNFYSRRKTAIKERLKAIENSDWSAVYKRVDECMKRHAGESFNKSIWNWLKYENMKNIEGFLMCLPTKFIALVAEWLLQDFSTYSSGLPDCTLWKRKEKRCLFVEVKSPGDTLAKHQEFWLNKIEEFGGNSLICHVKEIASCAQRLNMEDRQETRERE